jgi:hypothetical protein
LSPIFLKSPYLPGPSSSPWRSQFFAAKNSQVPLTTMIDDVTPVRLGPAKSPPAALTPVGSALLVKERSFSLENVPVRSAEVWVLEEDHFRVRFDRRGRCAHLPYLSLDSRRIELSVITSGCQASQDGALSVR